jgi:small conductance mechanosensitive channel
METNTAAGTMEPLLENTSGIMETIQAMAVEYGMKILGALLIIIVGMWLARMITRVIVKVMDRHSVDPTLTGFVSGLSHIALQVCVIIAALEALNFKTTSLIAVLGAAGLAVGLALQGSLSNFAAGVLMIIFKPFRVGEVVEAGGVVGKVREIGILTTIIDTLDNRKTIVPNSKLMSDNITNYTANDTRRVDLSAGISYGDDIDKARSSIVKALREVPGILDEPAPEVFVSEMADSSVNFAVRPWCRPADYWGVYFGVPEAIKKQFDADDVTIPFPQRDVHLYENKNG